ncbi:MAG: DUF1579 domain-containing protein [Planctomycetes bacterium]|nr:DUF1579 domain-containing protein [Planctomycetota bacterium]
MKLRSFCAAAALAAGLALAGAQALAQQDKPKTDKPAEKAAGEKAPAKPAEKATDPHAGHKHGTEGDAHADHKHAEGGMPPGMEEAMKRMAPGESHAIFKQFEGKWKTVSKFWMEPTSQPEVSEGTAERKLMWEGRFVQSNYKGMMGDQPFEGLETLGYDNMKKKYVSTWMDSTCCSIMLSYGTYDPSSKSFTFSGEYDNPMTGQTVKSRNVIKLTSPDSHSFEMYDTPPGGKEYKSLEVTYTRAK